WFAASARCSFLSCLLDCDCFSDFSSFSGFPCSWKGNALSGGLPQRIAARVKASSQLPQRSGLFRILVLVPPNIFTQGTYGGGGKYVARAERTGIRHVWP